jgi:RNA polymerase sigma-70 factor (ECF subfamily)
VQRRRPKDPLTRRLEILRFAQDDNGLARDEEHVRNPGSRLLTPDSRLPSNPSPAARVRETVRGYDPTLRSRVHDQELIGRVLAGDPSAERALYDAHVDRVFRLVYRMAGDLDRAQDYTQETFIRAFDRLAEFRGEAALSTWLGSIAISITLNGLRKVRRLMDREVALDEALAAGRTPSAADPDLKDRLAQAIDDLPDGYRVVFVMHDVEGFTHEEIASSLGVHPGTSKAQLFRARSRLREALADFAKD